MPFAPTMTTAVAATTHDDCRYAIPFYLIVKMRILWMSFVTVTHTHTHHAGLFNGFVASVRCVQCTFFVSYLQMSNLLRTALTPNSSLSLSLSPPKSTRQRMQCHLLSFTIHYITHLDFDSFLGCCLSFRLSSWNDEKAKMMAFAIYLH